MCSWPQIDGAMERVKRLITSCQVELYKNDFTMNMLFLIHTRKTIEGTHENENDF